MDRCKSLKHEPRLSRFCCFGAESCSGISLGSDFTGEQSRLERMSSPVVASRSVNAGLGLSVLPQGGGRGRNPPGFVSLNRWKTLHLISCLLFHFFVLPVLCLLLGSPTLPPSLSSSRLSHLSCIFDVFLCHRCRSTDWDFQNVHL